MPDSPSPRPPPEAATASLPPRVTPILTAAINDPTMPPPLFRSYARLYAASWRHAYQRTAPLDFDAELVPLLGVRPTQARQHLRYLRFAKLLDWESDGNNRYVIHFPAPPDSENPESVVVVGVLTHDSINTQQQQLDSAKPDFRENRGEEAGTKTPGVETRPTASSAPERDLHQTAMSFLERAGVWPDVAVRIANKLVENQRRGHDYLPSLADVLGWMAYCFADREKNNIAQPAAVLAANLNANRRCPESYRPLPVCAACGFEEEFCECEGEPDYRFPPAFLDYALKRRYETYTTSIWGVCLCCHAFPCQCGEE